MGIALDGIGMGRLATHLSYRLTTTPTSNTKKGSSRDSSLIMLRNNGADELKHSFLSILTNTLSSTTPVLPRQVAGSLARNDQSQCASPDQIVHWAAPLMTDEVSNIMRTMPS